MPILAVLVATPGGKAREKVECFQSRVAQQLLAPDGGELISHPSCFGVGRSYSPAAGEAGRSAALASYEIMLAEET